MSSKTKTTKRPNPATATQVISQKDRKVKGIQALARSEAAVSKLLATTKAKSGEKYVADVTERKRIDENGVTRTGKTVTFKKASKASAISLGDGLSRHMAWSGYIREAGGRKPKRHVRLSWDRRNKETKETLKQPVPFINIDGGSREPLTAVHLEMFGIS